MEALVSRRVGCRATAADLVQDLFLRFWRRPLVQVEELSTYLLRCAGNIAIDHLRSEGARVRAAKAGCRSSRTARALNPRRRWRRATICAMSKRPCAACPSARGRFSCSTASMAANTREIAKAMGLSQSAVEKHMMRALEACKASLREPSPHARQGKHREHVTPTPAQEQAALAWLSLLHDQPSSGDQATFSQWLRADPAHAEAYAQAQVLWELSEVPGAHAGGRRRIGLAGLPQCDERSRRRASCAGPARWPWRRACC